MQSLLPLTEFFKRRKTIADAKISALFWKIDHIQDLQTVTRMLKRNKIQRLKRFTCREAQNQKSCTDKTK